MRAFVLLALILLSLAAPAFAADDGQSLIRSQEQAIVHDDATAAYSFASPAIQSMFGTADIFMSMVKQGYPPIYRHRSFEFGDAQTVDENTIRQMVNIVDAEGVAWVALYTLERQPDGSLKISGCSLMKAVTA
jgi:hypothetical protein